jgi:hypothetical protein
VRWSVLRMICRSRPLPMVPRGSISCIAAHARLNFGLVDPLDERFYPIDRAARDRAQPSAPGPPRRAAGGASLEPQRLAGLPLGRSRIVKCLRASSSRRREDHHGYVDRANERSAGTGAPRTSEIYGCRKRGRSPRYGEARLRRRPKHRPRSASASPQALHRRHARRSSPRQRRFSEGVTDVATSFQSSEN